LLSQTSEYALRAVVCLAARPEASLTTQEIAEITKVPVGYLSKVLQALRRAGLVRSQRGLRGGFVLARPPAEVTLLEVVNAVDPWKRIHTCPLGLANHGEKLCTLHHRLDQSLAHTERALAESTVAEMVAESKIHQVPLCDERKPASGASGEPDAA